MFVFFANDGYQRISPISYRRGTSGSMGSLETVYRLAKMMNNHRGSFRLPVYRGSRVQDLPDLHYYNQTMLLKLPKDIDLDQLEVAMDEILKQHDALRLRFTKTEEGWEQIYGDLDGVVPFSRIDLSDKEPNKQQAVLSSKIADFLVLYAEHPYPGSLYIEIIWIM